MYNTTVKKYRVKSIVKSFRDLEVYEQTNLLAKDIFIIQIPEEEENNELFLEEIKLLRNLVKQIPRLIAESYGDRFSNKQLGITKMEKTLRLITDVIVKIDFLIVIINDSGFQEKMRDLLKKYQIQRKKVLYLKNAWEKYSK